MNARHIGANFTSLLYIAVTSSVFLSLDLSHPPPPTLTLPACGVGGGGQPIPLTLWDENCVGGV